MWLGPTRTPALSQKTACARIPAAGFDYRLPLGDLLKWALPHHTPAQHPPYLKADAERTDELRSRYLGHAGGQGKARLIGLSWHTTNPDVGFTRNLDLSVLDPLFSIGELQFVSLQYGDHAKEIAEANRRFRDVLFSDPQVDALNDIDALAAQMCRDGRDYHHRQCNGPFGRCARSAHDLAAVHRTDWRWGLNGAGCRCTRAVRLEPAEGHAELEARNCNARLRTG